MNQFRANLLGTGRDPDASPLAAKRRKHPTDSSDSLASVAVRRAESRTANQRGGDRHRLNAERAEVRHDGAPYDVALINLSPGGAMIEGDFQPHLWDRVDLVLGEDGTIECAVRWVRDGRVGLEFAHETRIDCDPAVHDEILRQVVERDFANSVALATAPRPDERETAKPSEEEAQRRVTPRHPLIWNGAIHYDHETTPVRLRNISASGALVESQSPFPVGCDLLLDLGQAGQIFATVGWSRGDQSGLSFHDRFDMTRLGRARPEVAAADWAQPDYLRDARNDASPWAAQWGRLSIDELHRTLTG